jgi:hypothetical protein
MGSPTLLGSFHSRYINFHFNHLGLRVICASPVFMEHTVQTKARLKQSFQKQELTLRTHMSIYEGVSFLPSLFWGGGPLVIFLVFLVERAGGLASGLGAVGGRTAGLVTVWGKELPRC